ncbi:MAG: hypothetical protein JXM68_10875, partial [Sedimentisphaerales bacterium]|nr:hypothetical protein [Sedimentisphaerales bacterium]
EYDDYGRVYDESGKWYYWESDPENDDDAVEGGITGYSDDSAAYGMATNRLHGWYNNDGDLQQGALEFLFTLEDGSDRQEVTAQIDQQFEMISDGDVVIEFDASLDGQGELGDLEVTDPLLNMDLYLYLTVNGRVVDINVNDAQISNTYFPYSGEVTPVAVCKAGTLMAMTQFKFDTTQMQYANGAAVDLTVGENTIGFIAYAANNGGVPVAAEQKGAIRIDNVVVYQRMISESRFVSGDTDTFDNTTLAAMTAWTPSGAVTGTLQTGVGQTGSADDDALNISFASSATQAGVFTRAETMSEYGYVRLDFDYRLVTDEDFSANDELQLTISTTAGGVLGTYTVTGANADSEWVRVSVVAPAVDVTGPVDIIFTAAVTNGDVSVAGTADVYIDNVDISHSLAIDLGGDIDLSDDDATDGSSWAYFDVGGITAAYNNTAGSDGDGAIEITLPDGSDASSYGAVGYYFETPAGAGIDYSYLSIDFSYNIELAANVGLGDFGQMAVMLVRDDGDGILEGTDTAVFSSDIGSFRQYSDGVTGGNSGWVDVTNYNIGVVDDNNAYFVLFIGLVSDSAAGADSYVRLDDLSVNYTGYSEWSSAETNDTDNGSNNTVGWNNNGVWNYNFRGDMHSALIDNGTIDIHSQLLTIPDYNQAYSGDAIVAFRYRHDGLDYLQANLPDLTDIRVLVDGV